MSVFKGSTTIDEAEVRGRFEGDLVVHNGLLTWPVQRQPEWTWTLKTSAVQ